MFAAAATFAQMVYDGAVRLAQFIATKALILAVMMLVLPWVLKKVMIWAFSYLTTYGRDIAEYVMSFMSGAIAEAGVEVNINLTGVGGYLAIMTGLIDYSAIIFTGWGLYWVIAVLAKTPRMIR